MKIKLGDLVRILGWLETLVRALRRVAPPSGVVMDPEEELSIELDPEEAHAAAELGVEELAP